MAGISGGMRRYRKAWDDPGLIGLEELAETVAVYCDVPVAQAMKAVEAIFATMKRELLRKGRIEIRNFGVFTVQWYNPRRKRPKGLYEFIAPGYWRARYRPAKAIVYLLNPHEFGPERKRNEL